MASCLNVVEGKVPRPRWRRDPGNRRFIHRRHGRLNLTAHLRGGPTPEAFVNVWYLRRQPTMVSDGAGEGMASVRGED